MNVMYVFDLGLTQEEQHVFLNLKKVEFVLMIEISQYTVGFLTPNQFAYKPCFLRFVFEHSDVQNVFWIDSGILYSW